MHAAEAHSRKSMSDRLHEVLRGAEANYIAPFLWQRGEPTEVIAEELARVAESGIRAVCVEARPHPDFLGAHWWRDFDLIMAEARRLGMRVWVLDDDHFPTGHAAGRLATAPLELRRLFLQECHLDLLGPQSGAAVPLAPWLVQPMRRSIRHGTLVAAVAAAREETSDRLTGELIDITEHVQDGVLRWDAPAGFWRIFLLFATPDGGSERHKDYVNYLSAPSVRVLIDTVYESFYARYKDDFGQTFAGFFSDEPGFYNDREVFDYESKLGKAGLDLPWCAEFPQLLAAELGPEWRSFLPLLWHEGGTRTHAVRFAYMQVVSRLYAENFTAQIGDWCRARGVEYIGHVLEDNGVHARLGCGAGHFFRALWGQDMAGIDVVLWQLVPGFDSGPFAQVAGDADGAFFHYGLGKLASSLAHLDPKKRGRAMCEVFGAYGWREGLRLMKWMTDHMLVRGVNFFVPHAFSQAEFPDPDCPPHMYARGQNPQFRFYRELNLYTNRVAHLLSGGHHIAPAAVLYHAEAEWSGAWMPFHTPVRALLRDQIDCDVLSADLLLDGVAVTDGHLVAAEERYGCLVVPASEALPRALLARLAELAEAGLPLLFVERLPERASEGAAPELCARLATAGRVIALDSLAQTLRDLGCYEITAADAAPSLRYYHVRHPDFDVFMLVNEHPHTLIATTLHLPLTGRPLVYDPFTNRLVAALAEHEGEGQRIVLRLSPYESQLLVIGAETLPAADAPVELAHVQTLEGPWELAIANTTSYPAFEPRESLAELRDMSAPDLLPAFSGTFRYETSFTWAQDGPAAIDLGAVHETAEVWVNGAHAGVRICPPYRFAVSGLLRPGTNRLRVEVTNTLVKQHPDFFSRYAPQEPSGLQGPVRLFAGRVSVPH